MDICTSVVDICFGRTDLLDSNPSRSDLREKTHKFCKTITCQRDHVLTSFRFTVFLCDTIVINWSTYVLFLRDVLCEMNYDIMRECLDILTKATRLRISTRVANTQVNFNYLWTFPKYDTVLHKHTDIMSQQRMSMGTDRHFSTIQRTVFFCNHDKMQ